MNGVWLAVVVAMAVVAVGLLSFKAVRSQRVTMTMHLEALHTLRKEFETLLVDGRLKEDALVERWQEVNGIAVAIRGNLAPLKEATAVMQDETAHIHEPLKELVGMQKDVERRLGDISSSLRGLVQQIESLARVISPTKAGVSSSPTSLEQVVLEVISADAEQANPSVQEPKRPADRV